MTLFADLLSILEFDFDLDYLEFESESDETLEFERDEFEDFFALLYLEEEIGNVLD